MVGPRIGAITRPPSFRASLVETFANSRGRGRGDGYFTLVPAKEALTR